MRRLPPLAVACWLALATTVPGQERPVAFMGAEVIPIAGAPLPAGTVVVASGKIVAVGPAATTPVPTNAERIDCAGKVIMPGLVDTHSHVGGGWGGDASGPIQPDVRILDSINVRDAGFRKCVAGGLTTLNIMPGSGHLLSGQTVYAKLRPATTVDDILIRDAAGKPLGGMKMANGTNSQRDPPFPARVRSRRRSCGRSFSRPRTTAARWPRRRATRASCPTATWRWRGSSTCWTAA